MAENDGLAENLIGLIVACGGERPASKSLGELYQALAVALASFTPGGGVESIVAGTNITVDDTDPQNPIVSATGGGGGSGIPIVKAVSAYNTEVTSSPPSGAATVDGYDVIDNDRILLTSQDSNEIDNGIWLANTSGLWTRPTDWATGSPITSGTLVSVGEIAGSFFYSSVWTCQGGTVDTDEMAFFPIALPNFISMGSDGTAGSPQVQISLQSISDLTIASDSTILHGTLQIQTLPTADPHIVHQLWNNGGVVNVSAG